MKKKYLAKRKTTVLVYQGKEQKIYGTDRPEVGSIPAISGIPAIEYRNRNSRYFFKNSVFHSIPLQNASIPFQIAGIVKTLAQKKSILLDRRWETHWDRSSDVNDLGYIPVQRSHENATTNDNEIITYVCGDLTHVRWFGPFYSLLALPFRFRLWSPVSVRRTFFFFLFVPENTLVLRSTTRIQFSQYSWIFSEYQLFSVLEYYSNTIFSRYSWIFSEYRLFGKTQEYSV